MAALRQVPLQIAIEAQRPDGFVQVQLRGSLDAPGALSLGSWLDESLSAGRTRLRLDLSGVDFVASSGVGCLVAATGELREEGGELILCGVQPSLRDMLEVLDLLDYLKLAPV